VGVARTRDGWGVKARSFQAKYCKLLRPIVEHFTADKPHPALRATLPTLRAAQGGAAHMLNNLILIEERRLRQFTADAPDPGA
jgi:hypothetical protein